MFWSIFLSSYDVINYSSLFCLKLDRLPRCKCSIIDWNNAVFLNTYCLQMWAFVTNTGMNILVAKSLQSPWLFLKKQILGPKGVKIFKALNTHCQIAPGSWKQFVLPSVISVNPRILIWWEPSYSSTCLFQSVI